MELSLKKQLLGFQSWIDLADNIELSEYSAVNRYSILSFLFVFVAILLATFIYHMHNSLTSSLSLFMHFFIGLNILKAQAVVTDALKAILNYKKLNTQVARFLNKKYSLFLVANGKKPLSEDAINNLEVHTGRFIEGKMTRGGRSDSIRRFRLKYLKKEKKFFDYLFLTLIGVELFISI
jgi:hypothetical protein